MGDFNFHGDNHTDIVASKFLDLLDSHNLVQHVSGPTHKSESRKVGTDTRFSKMVYHDEFSHRVQAQTEEFEKIVHFLGKILQKDTK